LQQSRDIVDAITQVQSTLSDLQKTVDGVLARAAVTRRFEDFVRATTDWVWETDANHNYTYASDAIATVLGIPAQLVVGKYLFSLSHFKTVDESVYRLVGLMDERRAFRNYPLALVDRIGTRHDIVLSGVPVFDESSGQFIGYRGTGADVTGRRREEEERRVRDERLRRAVDASGLALWDWEFTTDSLTVSPSLRAALSLTDAARLERIEHWHALIPTDDLALFKEAADAAIEGRSPRVALEHRLLRGTGEPGWFALRATVERDPAGKPLRLIGTYSDVTERRRAEEADRLKRVEAESSSRSKTEVLAKLSHELKTPLNAIIGFSEALRDNALGPLTPEKMREYAGDINLASQHLLALVNDMLDMAKAEAGQIEMREDEIVVEELIREAMRMVDGQAHAGGVRTSLNLSPGIPRLRADRRLIRQVLLNLLTNAIKFTRPGGLVTVRGYRAPDGGIVLGVSDTGIGMAREDIPKALAPFGRVPTGLDIEGTGLGLPIAVGLVERHGGTLRMESEKGVGTDVFVTFPPSRSIT
jgi:PAS domain S-box-containing protein